MGGALNGCWSYSPTCLSFNLHGGRKSIFCCMAPSWCAALKRPRLVYQLTMNLNDCEPIQTFHFFSLQMGYFRLFLNIFTFLNFFYFWNYNIFGSFPPFSFLSPYSRHNPPILSNSWPTYLLIVTYTQRHVHSLTHTNTHF